MKKQAVNRVPRVGFVCHSSSLGGAEKVLLSLLQNMPRDIIHPIIICPPVSGPVKEMMHELKIPIIEMAIHWSLPGYLETASSQFEFQCLFSALELDLVVINTTTLYEAVNAAKAINIPIILHSHGIVSSRLFKMLDQSAWFAQESHMINIADRVLCPSATVAEYYSDAYAPSPSKVHVVPNGTKKPVINPSPVKDNKKRFVMLCTLEPNKGVHTLIEAVALLKCKYTLDNVEFHIYGEGSNTYLMELNRKISLYGLNSYFFIHPKQKDVAPIYETAFAVIVASLVESFSMVVIEAMSYGKPVIATRCGGPDKILTDQKTGLLIEPGNVKQLADAMASLLAQPSFAFELAMAAKADMLSRYDILQIVKTYCTHIIEVIDSFFGCSFMTKFSEQLTHDTTSSNEEMAKFYQLNNSQNRDPQEQLDESEQIKALKDLLVLQRKEIFWLKKKVTFLDNLGFNYEITPFNLLKAITINKIKQCFSYSNPNDQTNSSLFEAQSAPSLPLKEKILKKTESILRSLYKQFDLLEYISPKFQNLISYSLKEKRVNSPILCLSQPINSKPLHYQISFPQGEVSSIELALEVQNCLSGKVFLEIQFPEKTITIARDIASLDFQNPIRFDFRLITLAQKVTLPVKIYGEDLSGKVLTFEFRRRGLQLYPKKQLFCNVT